MSKTQALQRQHQKQLPTKVENQVVSNNGVIPDVLLYKAKEVRVKIWLLPMPLDIKLYGPVDALQMTARRGAKIGERQRVLHIKQFPNAAASLMMLLKLFSERGKYYFHFF